MITIINVELRLKSVFVSQRFRLVSFRSGFISQTTVSRLICTVLYTQELKINKLLITNLKNWIF